jgi:hypothetical protein
MKKKLFIPLALLLGVSLTAAAQKEQPSKLYAATLVSYNTPFTKIVVNDGIELVLTENSQEKIWFDGKARQLDKLRWEIKNGTLYLSGKNGSLKDKVRVSVCVQKLRNIEVNGDSWVRSSGYLTSPALDVLVNGEAMVDISNVGKIAVNKTADYELGVMKKTSGVSVAGTAGR